MRKLASAVANREGKRSQTSIGNVRETLKTLVEILAEEVSSLKPGMCGPLLEEYELSMKKAVAKAKKKVAILK